MNGDKSPSSNKTNAHSLHLSNIITFKRNYFKWYIILVYLILPAAPDPGVYSASNRNEYQKHKINNVSGE
jgi:hypothetical protein